MQRHYYFEVYHKWDKKIRIEFYSVNKKPKKQVRNKKVST